jgi:hypothetical protein
MRTRARTQVLHQQRERDVVVAGGDRVDVRLVDVERGEHVAVDAHLGRVHLGGEAEPLEVTLTKIVGGSPASAPAR